MRLHPKIFKSYDIRGIYPEELDEEGAYRIGQAFARFLKIYPVRNGRSDRTVSNGARKIVMGRDIRLSSPSLAKHFRDGVLDQGTDVIDIGLAITPMLYFACAQLGCGGVMVTASHNPKGYNGFKLVRRGVNPIGEESGLLEIKKIAEQDRFRKARRRGKTTRKNFIRKYIAHVFETTGQIDASHLKIAADAGNGAGGLVLPDIFNKLGCRAVSLFWKPDGSFPNHLPDPSLEENLVVLKKMVVKEKADLGIAVDGDSDRIVFIDETGQPMAGDCLTALFGEVVLKDNPGGKIVYDITSSRIVSETIKKAGGQPVCSRVGHTFIKEKMTKEEAIFAGESSGHYYLNQNDCVFEIPFIALGYFLRQMIEKQQKASQLIKPFQKYYSPGEINFPVSSRAEIKKILNRVAHTFQDDKINRLDGLTVEFKDWWFNLRPSNTTPLIRLNMEGDSKKVVEENLEKIKRLIAA